jgi:PKD repeat protein
MRRALGSCAAVVVLSAAFAASAPAFTTYNPPFTGGVDIATGFPTCFTPTGSAGPTGVAFDGQKLFVADTCNGLIYRFGPDGGTVATAEATSAAAVANGGLTVANGRYYGTRFVYGSVTGFGVVEFDPVALTVIRTVSGPTDPRGITTDPLTGDLYYAEAPGPVRRIANPIATPVDDKPFANPGLNVYDGIAFTADGSRLYVTDYNTEHVLGLDRSGATVFDVSLSGHHPDGIAVVRPNTVIGGVDYSNNVFVNNNDGTIQRIDVNSPGNPVTVVASGGTRGDFTAVGPDGCFYATQSDRVVKLAPCIFQQVVNALPTAALAGLPNGGKAPLAVAFSTAGSADREGPLASWTLDFGDGTPPASGTGDPPASIPHTYAAAGTFTATLTVKDKAGASATARVTTTVTAPAAAQLPALASAAVIKLPSAKACVSRRSLRIRLVQPKDSALVSAVVRVNGTSVRTVQGARITAPIDLKGLPKGRFTVKITATTADGRTVSGTRKYRTCTVKRKGLGKLKL